MNTIDQSSEQNVKKTQFPVTGMNCMGCVSKVKSALSTLSGVEEVSVNLANGSVTIRFDNQKVDPVQFQQAVGSVGYNLII